MADPLFSSKQARKGKKPTGPGRDGGAPVAAAAGDAKEPPAEEGEEEAAPSRASLRITQTALKILAQARQSLLPEEAPRRRARARTASKFADPEPAFSGLSEEERGNLLEVTDKDDEPLLCMAPKEALRQGLRLRLVCLLLRTRRGTVFLHKRKESLLGFAGCWDAYTDFIHVGESREDAALRLLDAEAGLGGQTVLSFLAAREGHVLSPPVRAKKHAAEKGGPVAHVTLFTAEVPPGLLPAEASEDILELDEDELAGLIASVPDMLTPEAIWAAKTGALF